MTLRHVRRLGAQVVVASMFGLLAGPWIGAGQASADPITQKRAEAARIARQLQAQGTKVDRLAEALDQAKLAAAALAASISATEVQLGRTQARAADVRAVIRAQALTLYVTGGRAATLSAISRGHPSDIVISEAYVARAFANEQDVLDQMRGVDQQLHAQQATLAAQRKAAADALARADAANGAAIAEQAAQEVTLRKVQGDLVALVAAEQQRLRAEEAARVQAALALAARQAALAAQAASLTRTAVGLPGGGGGDPGGGIGVAPAPVPAPSGGAAAAIAAAVAELGKPYVWAGAGPGAFDCSGLTMWAWRAGGVSLSHGATAQYFETAHVALSQAAPGDLVFYGSPSYVYHVGLYVGGGQMIEAENSGTVVHYASIYRSGLMSTVGRP